MSFIASIGMNEPPQTVIELIETQMRERGFKQKDLAEKSGIPQPTLSLYMSGKRGLSNAFFEACSELLGIEVGELKRAQANFDKWKESGNGRILFAQEQLKKVRAFPVGSLLSRKRIMLHIEAGDIDISPMTGVVIQKASVDLTRGECHLFDNNKMINLEKNLLILSPRQTARIHSVEKLKLPEFMIGRAGGLSFHTRHGVSVDFGLQFDPGYEGHPFALFTNNGNEKLELSYGEPFLSIDLTYLAPDDVDY